MKRLFSLLILTFTCISTFAAYGKVFEYDGMYYEILSESDGTCQLTNSYKPAGESYWTHISLNGDIEIPELVVCENKFYRVTEIGQYAIQGNINLLKIPASVNKMINSFLMGKISAFEVSEDNAYFSSQDGVLFNKDKSTLVTYPNLCESISYAIPNSVNKIENNAFLESKLEELIIPSSVVTIGDRAFQGMEKITSFAIPHSVKVMGKEVFYYCTSLNTVSLPGELKTIDKGMFSLTNLKTLTIPAQVSSWERETFPYSRQLEDVYNYARSPQKSDIYCDRMHVLPSCKEAYEKAWGTYYVKEIIGDLEPLIESVSINDDCYTCEIGSSFQPSCTTLPFAMESGALKWTSSDPSVLYIDKLTGLCLALKSGTVTISVTSVDKPELSASAEVVVGKIEKCGIPRITYENSQLVFTCPDEGAICHYSVEPRDNIKQSGPICSLSCAYDITAYATKKAFNNSESVFATLFFDTTPNITSIDDLKIKAIPILINTDNTTINISGLRGVKEVSYYNVYGQLLGSSTVFSECTSFNHKQAKGTTIIVKYDDNSIRILVH